MTFTAPITQLGQDAYDYLEPLWADDDQRGYPLQTLIAGLAEAFRQVEEVARAEPGRDPYQQAWDITRCPDYLLPFFGQAVGNPVTPGADPDVQRAQISAELNFYRGSVQNLLAAAAANQSQPNRTTILERVPDAWSLTVSYDPAYTPDVTAYTNAVTAAVPWGLALTIESSSLPMFEDASASKTFESVGSAVTFESANLSDVT
jgi:hypothetical protein